MPDHLAHYLFAQKVLNASNTVLRRRINADSDAFRAGTFGPDPLFNDPASSRREEGFAMHRNSGRKALERMRRPLEAGMPWAMEYTAGFFCHYALDRLCHPDILNMAAQGVARHVAIESAYDRELLLREGIRLPKRILLSRSTLETAACMYRNVGPRGLGMDIEIFWQIRRFVIFGGGTSLAAVPGWFNAGWNGLIPYKNPAPELKQCFLRLDELMEESVQPAARQMEMYFEAIDQKLPLSDWLCVDFSGFPTSHY